MLFVFIAAIDISSMSEFNEVTIRRFRRLFVKSNDVTAFSLSFAPSDEIADYRDATTKSGGGGYYPDMRLLSLTVKPVLANSRSLHGTSSRVSSSPTIITGYHMLYGTIKGIGMAHIRP
jgi:hypothetical protein